MDEFATLPATERRLYIQETAARMNISEVIIEKDFWVCWTLKKLFSIENLRDHLIFKGGTSLSKCYGVIQRFSEDIDISINREHLGFGGNEDPAKQSSRKKKNQKIKELGTACTDWVKGPLKQQLLEEFSIFQNESWELMIDPDDKDQQTLLFAYPSALDDNLPYIKKAVKIEMGARSDHWPADEKEIKPYISAQFPLAVSDSTISIHVLDINRTFWEKVTLLHAESHRDLEKPMPLRMSRHLYDLWAICQSDYLDTAIKDLNLLSEVSDHKTVFFKSGWARYDLAKPGSLRIIPSKDRIKELEQDYQAMRQMFFTDPPPFSELITTVKELENRINNVQ